MTGKYVHISGGGDPLLAREVLIVAFLRLSGFRLASGSENFQDSIGVDGVRKFVFLFSGEACGGVFAADLARDIAGGGHWLSPVYAAFSAGSAPVSALRALAGLVPAAQADEFAKLVEIYRTLLGELSGQPLLMETRRGSRRFWLPADLTDEEREARIRELSR